MKTLFTSKRFACAIILICMLHSFKLVATPTPFSLFEPTANAVVYTKNNTSSLAFKWGVSSQTVSYKLFLYNHQGFLLGAYANGIVVDADTVRFNLPISTIQTYFNTQNVPNGDSLNYTWLVSAYGTSDSLLSTNQLNIWFVNLAYAGQPFLKPFSQLAPQIHINYQMGSNQNLVFNWFSSHIAANYKLYIDSVNGSFNNGLFPVLDTMFIADTFFVLNATQISAIIQAINPNALPTDTFKLKWHVKALRGGIELFAVRPMEFSISISQPTSITKQSSISFQLYPNPAKTKVFISCVEPIEAVSIYDITGKTIAIYLDTNDLDVSLLPSGMYHVEVVTKVGSAITKLLVE